MSISISVVIPLYNKSRHISRAIDSVLNQTILDFELLIINDGSTDNSLEIAMCYSDTRIRIINQKNSGVSVARNRGIVESTGELIAFLDADDAWEPEFLSTVLNLANKYPQAGAYATGYEICNIAGKRVCPVYNAIPKTSIELLIPSYFRSAARGDLPISASSVCIPRQIFNSVGMFPPGEIFCEDLDMWSRIALKYPIAFSWKTCAVYFQDSDNRACVSNVPNELFITINRLQETLDKKAVPDILIDDVEEFISMLLLNLAAMNVRAGNISMAQDVLRDARTKLFWKKRLWWMFWSYIPHSLTAIILRIKHILNLS